jgi:hypothetical protein
MVGGLGLRAGERLLAVPSADGRLAAVVGVVAGGFKWAAAVILSDAKDLAPLVSDSRSFARSG